MVSKESLHELKIILKDEFGLELDEIKVREVGDLLIRYYDWLLKINSNTYENRIPRP